MLRSGGNNARGHALKVLGPAWVLSLFLLVYLTSFPITPCRLK
jgi:hypothetical protein